MDSCSTCSPSFSNLLRSFPIHLQHRSQSTNRPSSEQTSSLLNAAFTPPPHHQQTPGLTNALAYPQQQPLQTLPAAYYRAPSPNCLSLALAHGFRGVVVGSVFGGAIGLSTAVSSGYRGAAAVNFAGQGALRNAAAFGSWTALYGMSRCTILRARGRDDLLNSGLAGAFTGATLTFIITRPHWRFHQTQILTNAAASAMLAVVFDAMNRM